MKRYSRTCLALALVFGAVASLADDAATPAAAEPRIGLVLAGGGARGLAHVGVIKYLEENNIRISAVAGTSMGSIVAGLYASGRNAEEIAAIVRTLDWRKALDDATPRDQLSMREKQEDFDFLIRSKLRFSEGKLSIPLGLVDGQHLNLLLHDLVQNVSNIHDFDQLPIPFRAVATDIVTSEPVVIGHGSVAVAMRASMSIPGFFAPVELDGKLLVDGGVSKNIPVDVVQGMGVDRLIVVDVGTPLAGREAMDSVLSLVGQLTTIITRKNSVEQLALMDSDDVLLIPDLDKAGVETMGFEKADEAMAVGYAAAVAMGSQLAGMSSPLPAGQAYASAPAPQREEPVIARVEVNNDSRVPTELLLGKISQPLGQKLDRDRLERDIGSIYGLEEFQRVGYELREESGEQVLVVDALARPGDSAFLKLGMALNQDSKGDSEFGIRASWRKKGINKLGAEWYTLAQLGGDSMLRSDFYQPLNIQQDFFLGARYEFRQRRVNVSNDGDVIARLRVRSHEVEIGPGFHLGDSTMVQVGGFAITSNTTGEIAPPGFHAVSEDDAGYFASILFDTLDRPFFPRSGVRLASRYQVGDEGWGADAGYDSWTTVGYGAFSWGDNTVLALTRWQELDLDDPLANRTIPTQVYSLGGFLQLSGYTRDSLAGNYLGQGTLAYYKRLNQQSLLPFDLPIYAGASLEAANVWLDQDDASVDDLIYAGSLFLGVDSPLGPVYMGVGVGEGGERAIFLQLGQILD